LGDPGHCDIRYTRRRDGDRAWADPVTVNSSAHAATATGTIRGAQIALGKNDSVHVIWNGNAPSTPDGKAPDPLLYSRLQRGSGTFSPHQNLLGDTTALDGGASIAANDQGRVAVVWHAAPPGKEGESARLVWVRYSGDNGGTFSGPAALNAAQPGVCACCSLRAHLDPEGELTVLYRAATAPTGRGMWLITTHAGQNTLQKLDDWRIPACPMSSASLIASGQSLRGAWENDGQIVTTLLDDPALCRKTGPGHAKHPGLARNNKGQTLVTSLIGSGWSKAGTLHWDILDAAGLTTTSGDGGTLPVWSYPAPYARLDGSFVVLR